MRTVKRDLAVRAQALLEGHTFDTWQEVGAFLRTHGFATPRVGRDYLTVADGATRHRLRASSVAVREAPVAQTAFEPRLGVRTSVYLLLLEDGASRVGYVGKTVDVWRRLNEHLWKTFEREGSTATELFALARRMRRLPYAVVLQDEIADEQSPLRIEASWVESAARAGIKLPGRERWCRMRSEPNSVPLPSIEQIREHDIFPEVAAAYERFRGRKLGLRYSKRITTTR